jgi:mitochondrial fission protein ELM1
VQLIDNIVDLLVIKKYFSAIIQNIKKIFGSVYRTKKNFSAAIQNKKKIFDPLYRKKNFVLSPIQKKKFRFDPSNCSMFNMRGYV